MKILFYLGHPAQYHFFKYILSTLKYRGHNIIILIKTKDILEQLLQNDGFEYVNIQKKSRKNNSISILLASLARTLKVVNVLYQKNVDLLIGTDSSIAQAAFICRKPAITTLEDDYEVIQKLAKLTYPFTSSIVVPTVCSVGKWNMKKISYQGYMKLAYLHPNRFKADINVKNIYIKEDKYCLVRMAQLTAHHDTRIMGLNVELIKKVIEIVKSKGFNIYISSEAEIDVSLREHQLKINHNDIHHVLAYASLLISDSQSMSVEASMLGVSSIRFSDFAGKISVLEELENEYSLTFGIPTSNPEKLYTLTKSLLSDIDIKKVFEERRQKMLSNKIDVTAFFVWFIENYPESANIMRKNPDYQYNFK